MTNNDKKTIKQRYCLWLNNLHFHISIQRKGNFFQVVIHEKYKKIACFLKIIFTQIGLISAFVIFQTAFISFLFAIVIYLMIQFLEKIIFAYTSLYVNFMPNFEFHSDKWVGAFFGYGETPQNHDQFPVVGWMFADEDFAKNIHSLLFNWTYRHLNDKNKNVKMSVILDEDKIEQGYIFFCYPSVERESAKKFYNEIEKERKQLSLTDVHYKFFLMLILGKAFKMLKSSYLPKFKERYRPDIPFVFQIRIADENMQPKQIEGLKDFMFHDLKIKSKSELNRKDVEYDLLRILE